MQAKKKANVEKKLILLVPVWLLNRLGYLVFFFILSPFKVVKIVSKSFKATFTYSKQIWWPKHQLHLPKYALKLQKKRRGRPRTQPFYHYLFLKVRRTLKKFVPTPLRIAVLLGVIVAAFFAYSLFLIVISHDLPNPKKLSQMGGPLTTEFYDRNGKLLYKLYEGRNRTLVNLAELPPYLINATVAIEDKNFFSHSGVDFFGIARALSEDLQNKHVQGGSTITQQLIKNTLLTPDRTITRKAKEVMLAFWAERLYDKPQILQMYFNEVPYGGPAWGIEAASETYFGKKAHDLTLAEASYLAGLPASPTTYSPYGPHPELAKERQKEVLRRMREDKYISPEEELAAYDQKLDIKPPISPIKAPHFVMYVRSLLSDKYGEKVVSQGGLRIITSLDLGVQEMAERVVSAEVAKLAPLDVTNGAAMINDAKTGQILAMVGSKDYFDPEVGNFNVALSPRQPGSSIKPITYVTGFKQGYSPGTILLDTPTVFKNPWETYAPVNYDGRFHGAVSIRTALGSSYNIPAVKMLSLVGIPNMIQTAHDMGITTLNEPDRYGLSLTLGGGEVKLIDMMSVYGVLSQNGIKRATTPILQVTDSTGTVLEDNTDNEGSKVIEPSIAYLITSILADNNARTPAFGPNSLLKIAGHTIAAKTGTTDSKRDNWTFGYTPEFVVGVWVGNNDNHPMNPALTSGVTGAAPIWNQLMTNLLQDKADVAFVRPPEVVDGIIDGHRDLIVSGQTVRSTVGFGRKRIKDEKSGQEKEAITFTDPFTTLIPDQPKNP